MEPARTGRTLGKEWLRPLMDYLLDGNAIVIVRGSSKVN